MSLKSDSISSSLLDYTVEIDWKSVPNDIVKIPKYSEKEAELLCKAYQGLDEHSEGELMMD